jgi:hypothetical protein
MTDLRYPIGKFKYEGPSSFGQKLESVDEVAQYLPNCGLP